MQKDTDSAVIQEKLKELYHLIHQCQEERNRSEHNLTNIAKTHERMQHEQKLSPYYKTKLRGLYNTAMQDAECEAELLRKALDVIAEVRTIRNERRLAAKKSERPKETIRRGALMKMLQQNALTLPLWIPKDDEKPPPLCGAVPAEPNYVAKAGDMVASLVKGPDGDENWILAEVITYNHNTNKYEIDDIDEEQKERHVLSRRRVVPLPLMRANPETNPDALFPKGALVMALYPQTTCFYRAVIHEIPEAVKEDYQVLFEDSSYTEGYSPPLSVAQRYVISCKESRKK
ncbi:SAGA-associated factor 29-like [Limulus polyphemus]|uniref:SAGA-associated factor 29-like n=1 Tax=Limulus polyphemus TaxID=6850 RepID=A0ABM1BHR8_LIMPO|nr:SAGA-associated factor 29-like [Limulus polyphemus]XP_013782251.1 SAGA-associated factor 29-like [Limulus polyphemus]XP_022250240.1 SAGA-associated factor 29-like [Limulus polyphemus]